MISTCRLSRTVLAGRFEQQQNAAPDIWKPLAEKMSLSPKEGRAICIDARRKGLKVRMPDARDFQSSSLPGRDEHTSAGYATTRYLTARLVSKRSRIGRSTLARQPNLS